MKGTAVDMKYSDQGQVLDSEDPGLCKREASAAFHKMLSSQ